MWEDLGPQLWPAFWVTIKLTFFSAIGALIWGVILAGMKVSPVPVMRGFATAYVNIVRNTPLTLILTFTIMVMLYDLGINLADENSPTSITDNGVRWAIVGLAVYHAAFVCEAIRSGINMVPPGQAEAARAIGLGFLPAARHVILPQALRATLPALGNWAISMFKDTPYLFAISVLEMVTVAQQAGGNTFRYNEAFTIAGLIFLVASLVTAFAVRRLEKALVY